jgi:predicted nuclease of restriction endonuclease-like (RecB) superfamily
VVSDARIVATLSRQLGWSHFIDLIPIKDPLKREFYTEMCRIERWSVRVLRQKIDSIAILANNNGKRKASILAVELDESYLRRENDARSCAGV